MGKVAYSIREAAKASAVSEAMIKDAIRERALPARNAESIPIVLHDDLKAWASSLPAFED